jgi:hypothetical protein
MKQRRKKQHRPAEIFISHSASDKAFTRKLAGSLRASRLRCWFSEKHIKAAQQWHDEIGKALGRCDWFVLVLSPASVRSKWVKRELLYALRKDRYEGKIVPLLLRTCRHERLSWTLDEFQRIDFRKKYESGLKQLLNRWR